MGVKMHEVLIKKNFIDKKIDDIQFQIKNCYDDKSIEELFNLLGVAQNFSRSITESNMKTKIIVGTTKTDVDTAVRVRKTLCRKIKTLSLIIKGKHDDLDVFPFLDQRDVLVEEFILLDAAIRKSDLETEVN
jgi:sialic acid synthase SpsE